MEKIIIGSTRKNAGKTSMIIALARMLGKKVGYIKPLGDRLLYKKKRLWDYDSALVTDLLGLNENPEEMSIGFEHAKLRYMYDDKGIKKKLDELVSRAGKDKDILFIEGPGNLGYGTSLNMDVLSIANDLNGKLVLVLGGNDDAIVDDLIFVEKYLKGIPLKGVIINKVHDALEFKDTHLGYIIKETGVEVLGIIPYREELSYFSVGYLADALFAKVIAGDEGLNNTVKRIFVGAMAVDTVLKAPFFKREDKKLVITSGDRSDMIVAALETKSSGVILTNGILPPSNIISKASELGIPLLLVTLDTYEVAKQLDALDSLLTKEDTAKISLLESLVEENIKFK